MSTVKADRVKLRAATEQVLGHNDFALANGKDLKNFSVLLASGKEASAAKISAIRKAYETIVLPEPAPQTVSMAQARIALKMAGLFDAVENKLNNLPDGPPKIAAQTAWEYSPTVSRTGELIKTLGAEIGLDDQALDALFIAAGKIKL